jgi:hypothetical protein
VNRISDIETATSNNIFHCRLSLTLKACHLPIRSFEKDSIIARLIYRIGELRTSLAQPAVDPLGETQQLLCANGRITEERAIKILRLSFSTAEMHEG